jgi:hypothetical protein
LASIHHIRGAFLEEIVLVLLSRSGYRKVQAGEEGTHNGHAGLEVDGRGCRHQIDALVAPVHSHAFVYPIRLLVEAKCESSPMGLAIVRSAVGTLFDINQNYFAARNATVQRFNYHAAMFAANGYTLGAERYALAHQVFLIDYSYVSVMRPIVDTIIGMQMEDFGELAKSRKRGSLSRIRDNFRFVLQGEEIEEGVFSEQGLHQIKDELVPAIQRLGGSYYGMIEGIYPVHFLSLRPIPEIVFLQQPMIPCEIRVSDDNQTWAFEPAGVDREDPGFFHLEFAIPQFVAEILSARKGEEEERDVPEWLLIANIKRKHFRFVDLTVIIQGRPVGVQLTLDRNWLDQYVNRRRIRRR